jgi:hypothetical protein
MVGWIGKDLEKSGHGPIGYRPGMCLERQRKATYNIGIAGLPTEIRTEHVPNVSLERYR